MPTTPSLGGWYSADTLYFTTEFSGDTELNTGRIYLGGTLVGKPSVWEKLPEPIHYEMVDLGLSVKWADRNVGAASPEAYGDYFMWGSTTPDTDNVCDWAHAPFNDGATAFSQTYFNSVKDTVCPNGVLAPEYDAAHAIMGGSWRMPTYDEMRELLSGTTQSVETLNGVKGVRFTSNANGNSIFMPLAGSRYDTETSEIGENGSAWSSSLNKLHNFDSYQLVLLNNGNPFTTYTMHPAGKAVRGVC